MVSSYATNDPEVDGLGTSTHFSHTMAQQIVTHATCPVITVRG